MPTKIRTTSRLGLVYGFSSNGEIFVKKAHIEGHHCIFKKQKCAQDIWLPMLGLHIAWMKINGGSS